MWWNRFIGFGYLMTFMKTNGLGAVGFTMLITAFGLQWYVFCESFFKQIYHSSASASWTPVDFTIYSLMDALFGVSAVLISFGAIIGKVTPLQLMVMTIIELAMHALNYEFILLGGMQVADIGGTYSDHMFGAYFGLAVAYMLGRANKPVEPAPGYTADIFAFIGTLFLWIYWPSFVGGAAQADSADQTRAIVNTILSLSASTLSSFYLSSLFTHGFVFRPVDIQNATLAGGVAIGCIANLNLNPVNAIFVGCAAGLLSTYGYHVIQPWLAATLKIHDTCGIHNLHAMPSVLGALASVILAGYKQSGGRNHDSGVYATYHGNQAWRQFVSILLVVTCAVVTGLITGLIMKLVEPKHSTMFEYNDQLFWETAEDFKYESSSSAAADNSSNTKGTAAVPYVEHVAQSSDELEIDLAQQVSV
jgi:ammonium transporter Rh